MKKIISTLAITFCLINYSNAQVMDSSMSKKPGHHPQSQDTTHSGKTGNNRMPSKNHKQSTDSTMNGVTPSDRKNNTTKPSTNTPQ